jgi:hypothetical protein
VSAIAFCQVCLTRTEIRENRDRVRDVVGYSVRLGLKVNLLARMISSAILGATGR